MRKALLLIAAVAAVGGSFAWYGLRPGLPAEEPEPPPRRTEILHSGAVRVRSSAAGSAAAPSSAPTVAPSETPAPGAPDPPALPRLRAALAEEGDAEAIEALAAEAARNGEFVPPEVVSEMLRRGAGFEAVRAALGTWSDADLVRLLEAAAGSAADGEEVFERNVAHAVARALADRGAEIPASLADRLLRHPREVVRWAGLELAPHADEPPVALLLRLAEEEPEDALRAHVLYRLIEMARADPDFPREPLRPRVFAEARDGTGDARLAAIAFLPEYGGAAADVALGVLDGGVEAEWMLAPLVQTALLGARTGELVDGHGSPAVARALVDAMARVADTAPEAVRLSAVRHADLLGWLADGAAEDALELWAEAGALDPARAVAHDAQRSDRLRDAARRVLAAAGSE